MWSIEKIANRNLWQLENTSVLTTVYYYFLLLPLPVQGLSGCVATSYDQIAGTKACSAITIQGPFTVPANKKIDLTGLKTGTTIKISMTIRDFFWSLFSPKKTPDSNLAFKNQPLTLAGTITFAKGNLDGNNDLVTIGGTNIKIDGTSGTLNGSGPVSFIIFSFASFIV